MENNAPTLLKTLLLKRWLWHVMASIMNMLDVSDIRIKYMVATCSVLLSCNLNQHQPPTPNVTVCELLHVLLYNVSMFLQV